MKSELAVVVLFCLASDGARAQTFSRVTTEPALGEMEYIYAVADLNGDGRDDILAGDALAHRPDMTPEDRLTKVSLRVFVGETDGSFTHAPELVDGSVEAHSAVVAVADFNNDARPDLAVFDAGAFADDVSKGYGNPPQLLLSGDDGVLRPSTALADAVRAEHEVRPPEWQPPDPADLHLKTATSGDIDGDGDTDLWVESSGGANTSNHFMVNNGDGTFTIEPDRATDAVLRNDPPSIIPWRFHEAALIDVDNDGDLDLVAGQLRDMDRDDQFSVVLVNDGTGHYPTRFELPHPAFNDGYTRVFGITDVSFNEDGWPDLLMLHVRNDVLGGWLSRYIQALVNVGDGTAFVDETSTWIADQSATTPRINEDGYDLYSLGKLEMHDIDLDGCKDLVVVGSETQIRTESPIAYRNNGSGQFTAMPPEPFAGDDHYFGRLAMPADVNGDGVVDFVVPQHNAGPDEEPETEDDFTTLVTLLNTTPAGPVRCSPRVTAAGTLPDRTLYVGTAAVVVSVADAFQNALTYQASSSAPSVATVSVSGSDLTVTAVAEGSTTITVTASGADNLIATQQFKATATAFTSAPVRRSRSGL